MLREIILDTETTGLNPNDGHRIIEIGCVEMLDRVITGNHYHVYINPEREVPEEAYRIHGISTDFLKDKQTFKQVAQGFVDFIAGATLVIHNASFDLKFLNSELERIRMRGIDALQTIDTLPLARKMFPGSPASLDALCKRFSISLADRKYHGALLDSELLARVYIEMMGGHQTKLLLDAEPETINAKKPLSRSNRKKLAIRPTRIHAPSAEELEAHTAFLKKIKNPVWG